MLVVFTFSSALSQSDPLAADTVIYIQKPGGGFDIIAGSLYRDVTPANKRNFERERVKRQLNNLAQLEQQVREQKQRIQADSASLSKEIEGTDPNDLYRTDLESLAGVWKLKIGDAADEITIDSTGAFTSKKSGEGTITVLAEGAKKIKIEIAGKKIPLARETETLFMNEKSAITLRRKKEGEGEAEGKNKNK